MNKHLLRRGLILCASLILILSMAITPAFAQSSCGANVIVNVGDTLVHIAQRCGVNVIDLIAANPQLSNPNRLLVGDILNIPGAIETPTESPFTVAIYPLSGAANTPIALMANGFPPNVDVRIHFARINEHTQPIHELVTDADGGLFLPINVPANVNVGELLVVSINSLNGAPLASSLPFRVTGDAPLPPTPTLAPQPQPTQAPPSGVFFDRANIYLISMGDGGGVGCGDSTVPVLRQFSPTVAPLTSALETLLSIHSDYYGESGLYNALYQSNLSLQGVNIVNGQAIINLSGQLITGGTCDDPRIIAQIEQTALQFATINGVQINVNGVPIRDALSQAG